MQHSLLFAMSFDKFYKPCRILAACISIFLLALLLLSPTLSAANAKKLSQDFMQSITNGNNYSCSGNEIKATCTASEISLEKGVSLSNVKFETTLNNNKNTTFVFSSNVKNNNSSSTSEIDAFLPQRFQCSFNSNLQNITIAQNLDCQFYSNNYNIKLNNTTDVQSDIFRSKNLDEAMQDSTAIFENIDSNNESEVKRALAKFSVNPKQIIIELNGATLGDAIFKAMQSAQPELTRESYKSTIALGVAMIPASLTQFKDVSSETSASISKAGGAIADVLISRKQSAKIVLKRKTNTPLNMANLPDFLTKINENPYHLLVSLNDYEITSTTK